MQSCKLMFLTACRAFSQTWLSFTKTRLTVWNCYSSRKTQNHCLLSNTPEVQPPKPGRLPAPLPHPTHFSTPRTRSWPTPSCLDGYSSLLTVLRTSPLRSMKAPRGYGNFKAPFWFCHFCILNWPPNNSSGSNGQPFLFHVSPHEDRATSLPHRQRAFPPLSPALGVPCP